MKVIPEKNILDALLSLLDDEDQEILDHVTQEFKNMGLSVLPYLEESLNKPIEDKTKLVLESLIAEIQIQYTSNALQVWVNSSEQDLLTGMLLIAKFQYPTLNELAIRAFIKEMYVSCWVELSFSQTVLEKIQTLNQIFYKKYGFKPNNESFADPQNSYINKVIDTRTGNPISLCVLYIILAQQLGLPIYGVNLPQHFILAYVETDKQPALPVEEQPVLFYINAYNEGMVFGPREIDQFLKLINIEAKDEYYKACNNVTIINRVINNLINAYQHQGNKEKINNLLALKAILKQVN